MCLVARLDEIKGKATVVFLTTQGDDGEERKGKRTWAGKRSLVNIEPGHDWLDFKPEEDSEGVLVLEVLRRPGARQGQG